MATQDSSLKQQSQAVASAAGTLWKPADERIVQAMAWREVRVKLEEVASHLRSVNVGIALEALKQLLSDMPGASDGNEEPMHDRIRERVAASKSPAPDLFAQLERHAQERAETIARHKMLSPGGCDCGLCK